MGKKITPRLMEQPGGSEVGAGTPQLLVYETGHPKLISCTACLNSEFTKLISLARFVNFES